MTRLLILIGFGLGAAGCGIDCEPLPGAGPCRTTTGAFGQEVCVCPTTDEGRACSDGSGCQGDCVGPRDACEEATTGQCSAPRTVFGCYCSVRSDGSATLCVD